MNTAIKYTSLLGTIFLFVLGESWIIAIALGLGFVRASVFISLLLTILSLGIVFFSENNLNNSKFTQLVKQWVDKKESTINPVYLKIYKTSKLLAVLIVALIAGPIILSIFTGFLNFQLSTRYLIAIICSILFSILWVGLYTGVITFFF